MIFVDLFLKQISDNWQKVPSYYVHDTTKEFQKNCDAMYDELNIIKFELE